LSFSLHLVSLLPNFRSHTVQSPQTNSNWLLHILSTCKLSAR